MEIEFEKLIQLQQLDLELQQIALFLESTPPQIKDLDKKIAQSSDLAAAAKEKMAGSQKRRRELEAEVRDLKSQISKYKRQLNEVKTNKEYTALLKEIEESEKKVDRLEEAFIAEMLLEDDVQKEIKEANTKYAAVKEQLSKEKEAIFRKQKEMEERARALNARKGELLPTIPAEQVNLYLRIYRKKAGTVLSPVRDDFCSMCHMRIRPQVLNELLATRKLILCENCGRILYRQEKKSEPKAEAKAE
ncbi:MAG: C4-type zinc ribbon domain-containing protein [Acidobacteriota bacterium]